MSEQKETGGPAFPNITPEMNIQGGPGMTLRDYFAGKAMQVLISDGEGLDNPKEVCEFSYSYADSMLEARKK